METEYFTGLGGADEMIRANGEAEARETDRLRGQVDSYEKKLEELKELYLKNNELIDRMQTICSQNSDNVRAIVQKNYEQVSAALRKSEETAAADAKAGGEEKSLETILNEFDDRSHKDNVRVYRNVQAAMIEELDRQTKELQNSLYALREGQTSLESEIKSAEDDILTKPEKKKGSVLNVLTFILALLTCAMVGCSFFGGTQIVLKFFGL